MVLVDVGLFAGCTWITFGQVVGQVEVARSVLVMVGSNWDGTNNSRSAFG